MKNNEMYDADRYRPDVGLINLGINKIIEFYGLIKSYLWDINIISKYHPDSIRELFDFQYKYRNTIPTLQLRSELEKLMSIISNRNINTMLEIGTARGGTLFMLSRIISSQAKIITVDFSGGGGSIAGCNRFNSFRMPLLKKLAYPTQQLHLLRADSHKQETKDTIVGIEKQFDLLFIDGDHSYEGVKQDYEMYSSLIKDGGLIVFHDIASKDVVKIWDKIKNDYKFLEIIHDESIGYGLGVLFIEK